MRAYDEINDFEGTLADEGMILVKFWMHDLRRGAAEALREREKRPAEELEADRRGLAQPREARRVRGGGRGHAGADRPEPHARWHLIAADSKRYARVEVIETVIAEIEGGMRRHGMEPPEPTRTPPIELVTR